MDSLSLYRPEKPFGYVLRIDLGAEGMRGLCKAEGVCNVCLSFISMEVSGRERGTFVKMGRHVSRSLEG